MRKSIYPTEAKTLGQMIRKRRMDLGKSLLEVATAANITESYLSRIEADKKTPTEKVVINIAKALNVDSLEYCIMLLSKIIQDNFTVSTIEGLPINLFCLEPYM